MKRISRCLLATLMMVAGTLHFFMPAVYMKIMPPYLPWHQPLVYLSGFFEIAFGVLLLIPRFTHLAAWGIFFLLIAVFPANIYLFQNQDIFPAPPAVHLFRLLLQGPLLLWAFWHTRKP